LPRAIFVIVAIVVILWINDTKIDDSALWPISLTAQFTCLDGSSYGSKLRDDGYWRWSNKAQTELEAI